MSTGPGTSHIIIHSFLSSFWLRYPILWNVAGLLDGWDGYTIAVVLAFALGFAYGLLALGSGAFPTRLGLAPGVLVPPLVPGRSLPAVPGRSFRRRYPPVFCGLDTARKKPIVSACVGRIGRSVTCGRGRGRGRGCSGGRGARELSRHFLGIRDASSRSFVAPYSPQVHTCILQCPQYPRQSLTHAPLPACVSGRVCLPQHPHGPSCW